MNIVARVINKVKIDVLRLIMPKIYEREVLIPFEEYWFKDKRVAIVGGSDSVLKEKLGSYIDDFDVVIRINKGVGVIDLQSEYTGSRTDFLFHTFFDDGTKGGSPITLDLWNRHKVGRLIFMSNFFCSSFGFTTIHNFVKMTARQVRFSQVPEPYFIENKKIVHPYTPTTGFVAINTVFQCRPKELYLTGLTFFKTPHNDAYRDGNLKFYTSLFDLTSVHNPDLEYNHVKQLYTNFQDIIRPDATLKQIFNTQ